MPRTTPARRRARTSPVEARASGQPSTEELGRFLARELHDSVVQTLATMLLELQSFRLDQHGREGALRQIDTLEQSTRSALADLRGLLVQLRGLPKDEEDLAQLIRQGMLERKERNPSIVFALQVAPDWPSLISANAAMELYRIAMEALDNAIRHGAAKRLDVALSLEGATDAAMMTITDDGTGLAQQRATGRRPRFGILGMNERAELLGGQVRLVAGPYGRGTAVQVTVPLNSIRVAARGA